MLLTTDNATWHLLASRGLPALLDRVMPLRLEYAAADDNNHVANRIFDVQKHYWGAAIIAQGFRALYLDADVVTRSNPLKHFTPDYEVQVWGGWAGGGGHRLGGASLAGRSAWSAVSASRDATTHRVRCALQGLSDWGGSEEPRVGDTLHNVGGCGLYFQVPDARAATGVRVVRRLVHTCMLRHWLI